MARTRVFIVSPAYDGDLRHDVCTHDGKVSVGVAYDLDAFELVQSFQSLHTARNFAKKKFGVKRVKVI